MVQIRPCALPDYEAMARIHNQIMPEPTSAEVMIEEDNRMHSQAGAMLHRVVAEVDGQILGYGFAEKGPWMSEGRIFIKATTDKSARGRGIGLALHQYMRQFAVGRGAVELESWVRGEDEESYAWAQRRGFTLDKQRTESVLDLTTFDMGRFTGAIERSEATGIRYAVYEQLDESLLRVVYELDLVCSRDVPIYDPNDPELTYEQFAQFWREDTGRRTTVLAYDGERAVGISIIHHPRVVGGSVYTGFTGVLREYRGRGIALTIKLLTIQAALAAGAHRMRTNNDPDNPPMLAVNAKLGYQLIPGPRRLRMKL